MKARSRPLFRRRAKTPEILYKFYGPDRVDVFDSFQVRFSQLAVLNDPFEFSVDLKPGALRKASRLTRWGVANPFSLLALSWGQVYKLLFKDEQRHRLPIWLRVGLFPIVSLCISAVVLLIYPFAGKHLTRIFNAFIDQLEDLLVRQVQEGLVLVFSCSEIWDSVPMWAHYAGNHTGFAISLRSATAFPNRRIKRPTDPTHLLARRVLYRSSQPKVTAWRTKDIGDFIVSKMSHWSYEREWRFVGLADNAARRGAYVGSHELVLFDLDPAAVVEVTFGLNCSWDTAIKAVRSFSQRGCSPDFFKVVQGQHYAMERMPLENALQSFAEHTSAAPIPSLQGQDFPAVMAAFGGMLAEARHNRILRWFEKLGSRRAD